MRRSLLLAAATLSLAAPTFAPLAASAQDRPEEGRHGGGHGQWRGQGGGQAAPAAQPAPAARPAPQAAPVQPQGPSAAAISARAAAQAGMDRRRLFTGPNDPAATPQDRAQLWGGRGREVRQDRQELRGDRQEFRQDRRELQGDRRELRQDRQQFLNGQGNVGELRRDRQELRGDRRELYQDRGEVRGDRRELRQDYRHDGQRFRGGWYSGDRRPFNYNGRTFYRFRADPYRWGGYERYQNYRWTRGAFLPRYFLLPDYFITDYYAFGLEPAPYGYQWVRVGYDVLLVNQYTGQIVEVVPGVFYW